MASLLGFAAFPYINAIERRGVIREAKTCAAVLEPEREGALDSPVMQLLSQNPGLAAVAVLDAHRNLASLYPDRPSFAEALGSAIATSETPVRTKALNQGKWHRAWAISVPLGNVSDSTARMVALLLWDDTGNPAWLAVMGIAIAVSVVMIVGCESHIGWIDLHVLQPIRQIRLAPESTRRSRSSWMSTTARWRELEEITRQFRQVVLDAHRIKRDALQRIDDDRKGYDLKLRRAEDLAVTDPLTGLQNRIFLESELDDLVRRQRGKDKDLSVVMIDLDNFKDLNDSKGHGAGDELLRVAGELLRAAIRPIDHAIRLGGDEFVLLLPGADGDEARRVAERIVKLFHQRVRPIDASKSLSMSAGIASLKGDKAHTGLDLLHAADAALYHVKRNGKNAVRAGRR